MRRLFIEFGEQNAVLRIVITRGIGKLHIDYRSCAEPQMFMAIWKVSEADLPAKLRDAHAGKDDLSLVITADESATHGKVVRVIDLAKVEGISKFAINVERSR